MNRRTILRATLAAALVPSVATAQTTSANRMTDEVKHASDTLEAGTVSLEASKAALSKVSDPALKRFASFEVAEQETVAKVVKAAAKMSASAEPKLSDAAKAMIDKMKAMPAGKEFDAAYLKGQIEGHTKLLDIQNAYLASGKDVTHRVIAMLASGHIKEHLAQLQTMAKA